MPRVFIPPSLRSTTGGKNVVDVAGKNVREVIEVLDAMHPGIKERLCRDGELQPGLSVVVGDSVSGLGLLQKVEPDSEVHFLPAIGGG